MLKEYNLVIPFNDMPDIELPSAVGVIGFTSKKIEKVIKSKGDGKRATIVKTRYPADYLHITEEWQTEEDLLELILYEEIKEVFKRGKKFIRLIIKEGLVSSGSPGDWDRLEYDNVLRYVHSNSKYQIEMELIEQELLEPYKQKNGMIYAMIFNFASLDEEGYRHLIYEKVCAGEPDAVIYQPEYRIH